MDADIARISFDYEFVQLANEQDIKLTYHRNEVRIDQAHLHGPDTDLQFSGFARFDRDRPLRFCFRGTSILRLIKGFLPDLNAQGSASVNVSVEGTMARPTITGRATRAQRVRSLWRFSGGPQQRERETSCSTRAGWCSIA